ncbi:post-GPI attachment to proteins factor 2-like [Mizuhopecten yessoensis]|uniref:post-GPI attachment to proteins factor 2-like n=1 Tax=Mizuhopecten yessoensis TaxID=6573 RepID=UPI000B45BAE3|nr:post-GPI attachment to proteins factor 2-like [Mizuhopecten yessoensis]
MGSDTVEKRENIHGTMLRIHFMRIAYVTVSLPAFSLLFCFLSGITFRFYDVNETVCKATNVIPSISAITGILPQAYVWRICIGLHSTPRFAVGIMYYNHYKERLRLISPQYHRLYLNLLRLNFWLYTIENSCLVAVTYISNKENYPLHEKIFIVFMVACNCYMLLNTIIYRWSRDATMSASEQLSYKIKKWMFIAIISATGGLLIFFVRHRFFCIPFAFSYFSACEYVIAYTNMAYHLSGYLEFKDYYFIAGRVSPATETKNGEVTSPVDQSPRKPLVRRRTGDNPL